MPKIRKPWVDWETYYQNLGGTFIPGAHTHIMANITDLGDYLDQAVKQASSPIFATVKLSDLTDGYVPYHVDDATGLVDSPIFTDGTDVGIGTPTPAGIFNVAKAATDLMAYFDTYDVDTGDYTRLYLRTSNSNVLGTVTTTQTGAGLGGIFFHGVDNVPAFDEGAVILAVQNGAAAANCPTDLKLYTYNAAGANNNQLILYHDGNIGIGTAVPLQLLHLEAFEPFLRLHSTRSGNYWELSVENATDVFDIARNGVTFIRINSTGNIELTGNTRVSATGYLHFQAFTGQHMYFDAGNEFLWRDQDAADALRMRLDSATGALTVNGTITATSFTGDVHWDNITNEPTSYPPLYHLHVGMDIVSLMLVDTTDEREPPADPFDVLTTGDHINGQGTYDWFGSWVSGHAGVGCSGKIEVLAGADKMLELIDSANINSMAHVYLDTSAGHELMIAALSVRLRSSRNDRKSAMYLYEGAAPGMRVELDSDGDIKLFDGAGTTVLQAYAANTWYTIRMYWDCVSQAVAIFVDNVFRTRKNITGTDFVGRIGFYTDITLESYTFHADDLKIFNLTV